MQTEKLPRARVEKDEYSRSDAMKAMPLPPAEPLRSHALQLKDALSKEDKKAILAASKLLLNELADAYKVKRPTVKILSVRPQEVTDEWVYQTFGDYDTGTSVIRLWMRTAVQKKTSSYGTFLSTLVHEFCHHMDVVSLEFPNTFHTRGFFERVAELYHHVQDTQVKEIVWQSHSDGTYAVNWASTMRNSRPIAQSNSIV